MLTFHLRLGFPAITLHVFLISVTHATCSAHLGEEHKLYSENPVQHEVALVLTIVTYESRARSVCARAPGQMADLN
jgi:hypothetical protein